MKIKDAVKLMIAVAGAATVFQTILISVFARFIDNTDATIYAHDLYQLPLIGVISALPILIFVRSQTASQLEWIIRRILHFVLTTVLVFGALLRFGWIYAQTQNAIIAFIVFLIAYTIMTIFGTVRANKLADKLNERINASHDM